MYNLCPSLNIFLQVNWICQEHCFKFLSVNGLTNKQKFLPVSGACPSSFDPHPEGLWWRGAEGVGRQRVTIDCHTPGGDVASLEQVLMLSLDLQQ